MRRRVNFIGSGYQVVKFIFVDTETMSDAFAAALKWYKDTKQTFSYSELEIPREYAYNV